MMRFAPASFFGIPLGLLGLGFAWRVAAPLWHLQLAIPELILAFGVGLWVLLAVLYAAKWVWARSEALFEIEHPVQCCFVGLGPVGSLFVGLAVLPYSRLMAIILFVGGAAGTLGFALFRTGRLWRGGRSVEAATPVLYLPAVAGSFVLATAASLLGWREWGQLAFGAGMLSWLAIESVLLSRLYHGPELAPPLRPTLGIQLAPPAVGALAYLNIGSGLPDMFVLGLLGYALLQAMLLARLARWIGAGDFTASYWAFSFGTAALATVCVRLDLAGSPVGHALASPVFVLANAFFVFLVVGTVKLVLAGRLLSAPRSKAHPTLACSKADQAAH